MQITFTSQKYVAGKYSYKRYIRKMHSDENLYFWCEVDSDDRRFDVRQGTATGEELPAIVKKACDMYIGAHYACEWPLC